MAKRRKDGLYAKQVTFNGKTKTFYGKTEAEIYKKIASWQSNIEAGRLFKDVAEEWKYEHFETLRDGTRMCYNPAYIRAVETLGDEYIKDIDPQSIMKLVSKVSKQGYSGKTIKTLKTVLNLIFNHAIINGDISTNPVSAVKLPRNMPKKKREIPSDDEIEKVKNSVALPFGLFAYFLLYTGCRRGEALAIQWSDIDFENRTISIYKELLFKNNQPVIYPFTKTDAGKRNIILLKPLMEQLGIAKKRAQKSTDYIFSDDGKLITERALRYRWSKYCKESEINVTPHQLRHAFATFLYEAGIDEKAAQGLLGHKDISVTKDIYTHIRQTKTDRVEAMLNEYIGNKSV